MNEYGNHVDPLDPTQPLLVRAKAAEMREQAVPDSRSAGATLLFPDGYELGQQSGEVAAYHLIVAAGHAFSPDEGVLQRMERVPLEIPPSVDVVWVASRDTTKQDRPPLVSMRAVSEDAVLARLVRKSTTSKSHRRALARFRDVTDQLYPNARRLQVQDESGRARVLFVVEEEQFIQEEAQGALMRLRASEMELAGHFFEQAVSDLSPRQRENYSLLSFLAALSQSGVDFRANRAVQVWVHQWSRGIAEREDDQGAFSRQGMKMLRLMQDHGITLNRALGWVKDYLLDVPGYGSAVLSREVERLARSPEIIGKLGRVNLTSRMKSDDRQSWFKEKLAWSLRRAFREVGAPYAGIENETQALSALIVALKDDDVLPAEMQSILMSPVPLHTYKQIKEQRGAELGVKKRQTEKRRKRLEYQERVRRYLQAQYGGRTCKIDGISVQVSEAVTERLYDNRHAVLGDSEAAYMELALLKSVRYVSENRENDVFASVRKARILADQFERKSSKLIELVESIKERDAGIPQEVWKAVGSSQREMQEVDAVFTALQNGQVERSFNTLDNSVEDFKVDVESFEKRVRLAENWLATWDVVVEWFAMRSFENEVQEQVWERLKRGFFLGSKTTMNDMIHASDSNSVGRWLQHIASEMKGLKQAEQIAMLTGEKQAVQSPERVVRWQITRDEAVDKVERLNASLERLLPSSAELDEIERLLQLLGSDEVSISNRERMIELILVLAPGVLGRRGVDIDVDVVLRRIQKEVDKQTNWTRTGR